MKLGYFFTLVAILNIVFTPIAQAGEIVESGTVLEETSMVFTLEEAKDMQVYISKLEEEVEHYKDIDAHKNALIDIQEEQIETFEEYLKNKDKEIAKYLEIQELDEERIADLEKRSRTKRLENSGAFIGGILAAIGLIIVADQLDDHVLEATGEF